MKKRFAGWRAFLFSILVSACVLPLPAEEITGLRDLAGGSVEWTELTGTGTLTNSSATLSVVTLTGAGNATFGGTIAGAVKLVKTGSGVQTLSTSNKGYTGGTWIEGGTLATPSIDFLGQNGNYLADSIVFLKNGACLRVTTTSGSEGNPAYMNQGLLVPAGESGVLETVGWITKDGSLNLTNATLTVNGGGGVNLSSWRGDGNSKGGRLVVSNAVVRGAAGGAFGSGAVPGFMIEVQNGGRLQIPADGSSFPSLVLRGGTVETIGRKLFTGNSAGNLETVYQNADAFDFGFNGTVTAAAETPSAIIGGRIALGPSAAAATDFNVAEGAELTVTGTLVPSSTCRAVTKSGNGVLRLEGEVAADGLSLVGGTLVCTPKTQLPALLASAAGAVLRLEDGADLSPRVPFADGLLASADIWLDAAQLSAVDGAPVASVPNLGVAGGSFTKYLTDTPTYRANGIGGKPALNFGTANLLLDSFTNKTETLTTFIVHQWNSWNSDGVGKYATPLSLSSVNPSISLGEEQVPGSFFYSFNGTVVSSFKAARGLVGADTINWAFEYDLGTSLTTNMPLLLEHRRNGSVGIGTAYCGEAAGASVTRTNSAGWLTQNIERVCLGGRLFATGIPNTSRRMNGRIGEVLVFTRALTDEEYAYVETYLKNKWFGAGKTVVPLSTADAYSGGELTVEVPTGATASFAPGAARSDVGGDYVKSGVGTLLAGDFATAARLTVSNGTLALAATNLPGRALIWVDPSDAGSLALDAGRVTAAANKGTLGGTFTLNTAQGPVLDTGVAGLNGNGAFRFAADSALKFDGFVRTNGAPRALHVYAVVNQAASTKFTGPFSFAHTSDTDFDKRMNGNFHYENNVSGTSPIYRMLYGYDARGLTNGLTKDVANANSYFIDLPQRAANGDTYLSVNHMGAKWQVSATVLAGDDVTALPWYSTAVCSLRPLNVNRTQLGASLKAGGAAGGEGGLWNGRIGEFIVFEEALPSSDEAALLAYLRKKWLGVGDGSTTPPACLAGRTRAPALHSALGLAVGDGATLASSAAVQPVRTLALDGATLERKPAGAGTDDWRMFDVAGGVSLSGALLLKAEAFPKDNFALFSYGTSCTGTYGWTLFGRYANLFRATDDAASKRFLFKYNRGTLIVIH